VRLCDCLTSQYRVTATNERGGRWWGHLVTHDLITGEAVVDCYAVDIGWGRRKLSRVERRRFAPERVEEVDDGDD